MLDPQTVRQTLAARGTRFVTVEFEKLDGTPRRINGLLRPLSRMKGSSRRRPEHLVPIWSPRDGWRSFDVNRVLAIR